MKNYLFMYYWFIILFVVIGSCNKMEDKPSENNSKELQYNYIGCVSYGKDQMKKLIEKHEEDEKLNLQKYVRDMNIELCLVPDAETAYIIADCVLKRIYGKKNINEQKPLEVSLIDSMVWCVHGILPSKYDNGGSATILIKKTDGQILSLYHTK